MKGSIARAQELVAQTPGAWMPQQFDNPANVAVHARTTAEEIARDFPDGIDALITGVGSGGHLTGCAQVLKLRWPRLKVFAVEAEAAREMARRCTREAGMLVGISGGATLAAIARKLPQLPAGAHVLGFNCDTGERYLSIEGFLPT